MDALTRLAETCPACGASDSGTRCGRCGRTTRVPTAAPGSLGAIVQFRRGRSGVLIDQQDDELVVLTAKGTVHAKPDKLSSTKLLPQEPTSRLGVLRRAASSVDDVALVAALEQHIAEIASDPDSQHVSLAHLLADSPDLVENESAMMGITAQERAWWCLRAADVLMDSAGVLRWSSELPKAGYEGRLLMWARALARPDTDRDELARLVEAFVPESASATQLRASLMEQITVTVSELPGYNLPREDMSLVVRGLDGESLPKHRIDLLRSLDLSLIDDLVDAGAIPLAWASASSDVRDHLALRMDPSQASIEAIIEHGPPQELRRRLAKMPPSERESTLALLDGKTAGQLRMSLNLTSDDAEAALDALAELLADSPSIADDLRRFREGTQPATAELLGHRDARDVLVRHGDLDRIPIRTLDNSSRDRLARRSLRISKDLLHDWDFDGAESAARTVLGTTSTEQLRDEALNLIAVSRYLKGDAPGAVAALKKALEGDYTLSLQTNMVVVAHDLDTDEEAEILAQLISEGPTQELRVAAAHRGLAKWLADDDASELPATLRAGLVSLLGSPLDEDQVAFFLQVLSRTDEAAEILAQLISEGPTLELRVAAAHRGLATWLADDDASELPVTLRAGLVSLLGSPLDEDQVVFFLQVLSRFDESWVRNRSNRTRVTPSGRTAFDVFHAQATGDGQQLLAALAEAQPAGWAVDMIEELAQGLIEHLEDDDEQKPFGFAQELLASRVQLRPDLEIIIVAALVFHVARAAIGEGEPKEDFIGFAQRARARLREVDQEQREVLLQMIDEGSNALVYAYLANRHANLEDLIDGVNAIVQMPRYQLNQREAASFLRTAQQWSTETELLLNRLVHITTKKDLLDGIAELRTEARRLKNHVDGMRL